MSALNAQISPASQSEERRAHEPSMEEILASIRRIIADEDADFSARRDSVERRKDDNSRASARREPPAAAPEPASHHVAAPALVGVPQSAPSAAAPRFEDSDLHFDAPRPQLAAAAPDSAPPTLDWLPSLDAGREEEDYSEDAPDSNEADYAEDASFTAYGEEATELAPAVESEYGYVAAESATPLVSPDAAASIAAQFQTLAASMVINDSGLLHDYAREMLRPMLKAWLDDNLPVLVERLVRAEIERVARGGRR